MGRYMPVCNTETFFVSEFHTGTYQYMLHSFEQPGSSVSTMSRYGLDDQAIGVRSSAGAKDFSYVLYAQTGSGAHPISCTMGTRGTFPGGKARPGRHADHSPHLVPSS
jgi:hypothetical protein